MDFKLFIDSIHILLLLYLLLWLWDFTIKNLQDFIKIYRALIKDIFLSCFTNYTGHWNKKNKKLKKKKKSKKKEKINYVGKTSRG